MEIIRTLAKSKTLGLILGLGALDGCIALAAAQGIFKWGNVLLVAFAFMAGPAAIVAATLIEGEIRERILIALVAGIFATGLVMIAAGFGPKLLEFTNINILKIVGGISVGCIALVISGIKIPENSPMIIMIIGVIASLIWRAQ